MSTHLLQRHWGSTLASERPTVAKKAKGQASSIINAAMSRRMGNRVTVINAICKTNSNNKDGLAEETYNKTTRVSTLDSGTLYTADSL